MKNQRELIAGFLAAVVSVIIICGSLTLALMENEISVAEIGTTQTPTMIIPSPLPGQPTLTPSSTVTPQENSPTLTPSCALPPNWSIITLNPGDTLATLAQMYGLTVDDLAEANCLLVESLIPGSTFYVPAPRSTPTATLTNTRIPCAGPPAGWVLYTIQPGDTLYSLGRAFGIHFSEIQAANCMGGSTQIRVGDQIYVPNVPTRTPTFTQTPTPTMTFTPSNTPLPTNTVQATATPTPTMTQTPSSTSDTSTPTPTNTQTFTPEPPTSTSTSTPSSTPSPTAGG